MTLTSESLPALLKLDKNQFIQSYIQGQRAHAKIHAEEGRSLEASWKTQSTPKKPSASGSHNVGFTTPILTARVSRAAADKEGSKKENITSKSSGNNQISATLPADEKTQSKKPGNKPDKTLKPHKSVKKRGADSHSDEDQVARLAERRERKRVKRAIVQAKEPSETDTVSSDGNNKKKKGANGKAKAKKPKVPAGLALMHGFTATNIGKNRLTLKPPSNVGVFKKGKASFNTKIKSKPKGHQAKHFSELLFLNNGKKVTKQAPSDASSDSDDGSATTSTQDVPKPKKAIVQTSRPEIPHTMTGQQASELSKVSASGKRPHAESEIWDIESRASEKRKLLGRKRRSTDEDSAIQMQGTVVMDARIPAWSNRVGEATGTVGKPIIHAEVELPDPITIPSSPSLRPSQSASQTGRLLVNPDRIVAASKYFAPPETLREPTPPPEPVVRPVGKSSEPAVDLVSPVNHDPAPVESCEDLEPTSVVPNNPVLSTRFVLPVRTRVFAEQFLSAQVLRSDPRDLYLPASHLADPHVTLDDVEDVEEYTWEAGLPDTLPDEQELDYQAPVTEESFNDAIELSDYDCPQSEAVWDPNDVDPVPDIDGLYDDGGFDGSVQYEETFDSTEYMDPVGNAIGYFESGCGEFDFGGPYHTRFIPLGNELGAPDSNVVFNTWEEASTNSLYSPGRDYFLAGSWSEAQETGDDFLADAHNLDGQEFFAFPVQASAVGGDSGDIVSECTESVSACTPRFAQGRALLLGLSPHDFANGTFSAPPHISSAEVDVVRSLRGHWLPQRL